MELSKGLPPPARAAVLVLVGVVTLGVALLGPPDWSAPSNSSDFLPGLVTTANDIANKLAAGGGGNGGKQPPTGVGTPDSNDDNEPIEYTIQGLSNAAAKLDPADKGGKYTYAGRALEKHSEPAGTFPRPSGTLNPENWNKAGQEVVDGILTNPESSFMSYKHPNYGRILDVREPSGRGIRYNQDGSFKGLLDPYISPKNGNP